MGFPSIIGRSHRQGLARSISTIARQPQTKKAIQDQSHFINMIRGYKTMMAKANSSGSGRVRAFNLLSQKDHFTRTTQLWHKLKKNIDLEVKDEAAIIASRKNGTIAPNSKLEGSYINEYDAPPSVSEINEHNAEIKKRYLKLRGRFSGQNERAYFSFNVAQTPKEEAQDCMRELFPGQWGVSEAHADSEVSPFFIEQDPQKVYEANCRITERREEFARLLNQALEYGSTSEKIVNLERFLYDDHCGGSENQVGIRRFNAHELQAIFHRFWNLGDSSHMEAYDRMVEMMECSTNTNFTNNPLNQEFYVKAQLKGDYFNPDNALALADLHIEKDPTNASGYGMKGVIYSIKKNAARNYYLMLKNGESDIDTISTWKKCFSDLPSDDLDAAYNAYVDSLANALVFFEDAFEINYDPRYGIRGVHKILEVGSQEKAVEFACLVQLACERDGAPHSTNFALTRAYLESLFVTGDHEGILPMVEASLLSLINNRSLYENALSSLDDLAEHLNRDTEALAFRERLLAHGEELFEAKKPEMVMEKRKQEFEAAREEIYEKDHLDWLDSTYETRSKRSNSIEGNFKFGAQLYAQNINRFDQERFREMLRMPLTTLLPGVEGLPDTLADVVDVDEFLNLADRLIRSQYRTDDWQLERLDSEGHKVYDETVESLIYLSGVKSKKARRKLSDSRTNIFANFALRLGDCRHHAQVKQLLFETWHSDRSNQLLDQIHRNAGEGNLREVNNLVHEFDLLQEVNLRTFDAEIHIPVKKVNGVPQFSNGNMIMNADGQPILAEEHTLNVLIRGKEVFLCDAFYHETYKFKAGKLEMQEGGLEKGGAIANEVELLNEDTGEVVKVPVVLRPTPYSGTRDVYNVGSNTPRVVGIPIRPQMASDYLGQKDFMTAFLESTRKGYLQMGS